MFCSAEYRRGSLFAELLQDLCGECGPYREEAAVSFSARLAEFFDSVRGVQFSVRVLSDLAHKSDGVRPGTYRLLGPRVPALCHGDRVAAERMVDAAVRSGCSSMAYTYTEPTIFMELCADCGRLAKERGLANVFVSNGYESRAAIDFAKEWLDGINVDLKAFNEEYYKRLCKARLEPVLDTIRYIAKETEIWLEITTLLIPGENDSDDELKQLAEFIVTQAGADVPWHISRFHPQYKYVDSAATPTETLERAYEIGKAAGLRYIYLGNAPGSRGESTFCYSCGEMLIKRVGYRIARNAIEKQACPKCGTQVAGYGI